MAFTFTINNSSEQFEFFVTENQKETFEAVSEFCQETLFAFNEDFLAFHSYTHKVDMTEAIRAVQPLCEDANPMLMAIIEDWQEFIEDAILADGAGHFLSPYDGQELEFVDLVVQLNFNEEKLKSALSEYTEIDNVASLRFYQQ